MKDSYEDDIEYGKYRSIVDAARKVHKNTDVNKYSYVIIRRIRKGVEELYESHSFYIRCNCKTCKKRLTNHKNTFIKPTKSYDEEREIHLRIITIILILNLAMALFFLIFK